MSEPLPTDRKKLNLVVEAVCRHFGLTIEELTGDSRVPEISGPRQVGMYLARELTGASLNTVARAFGRGDHTTVISACKTIQRRCTESSRWSADVDACRAYLAGDLSPQDVDFVDEIAVERAIEGDLSVTLNRAELREAWRALEAEGLGADEIGDRLGTTGRNVKRWRVQGDVIGPGRLGLRVAVTP